LPVFEQDGEFVTKLGLGPDEGGYTNDPVLGVVRNLGLDQGALLDGLEIYVGILAATILFIATNAGVIGASRITYAMASYRQLPEVFRRLHPKFKTPWLSLVVFAGIVSVAVLLPGQTDFLGDMYAFGAMLSFTIAHLALVRLRYRHRDEELAFRGLPLQRLADAVGPWPATATLAVVFGAVHLWNPAATFFGALNVALAGVWLSIAFFSPGGMGLAWGLHFGWNATLALGFDAPVSGIMLHLPGPEYTVGRWAWFDGGAFGPEGGLVATIAIVAGTAYLLKDRLRRRTAAEALA